MRYGNIKTRDIADGPGVRVSLFVSGCTRHCAGCFQPETWDFAYGTPFTGETEENLMRELSLSFISGLTLLGGEPFEPENQRALLPFLRRVRGTLPDKTVWSYSGCTWEELTGRTPCSCRCEATDEMLSLLDVLVDGAFQEDKKNISLRFRGSSNQRLIDVSRTLKNGVVSLWSD